MIDNVNMKISSMDDALLLKRLEDSYRKDINTYSGNIGNLGVYRNLDGVHIHGSLAKYLSGENITPLTREQVREAIEKLEVETGLDLSTAIVKGVECGLSITTNEYPSEYLKLFGYPGVFTRHEFSKLGGIETVSYSTNTGAFQFIGYDKMLETKRRKLQDIPPAFEGKNVLRLEYKIVRRRGIKAKFKRDLTAYDLFDPDVYRQLQNLFVEKYNAIPKFGRQYCFTPSKNITPKKWVEIQADQYRHILPKENLYLVQTFKESGALTGRNMERIRAAERRRDRENTVSDTSPLITELDVRIHTMMKDILEPVTSKQVEASPSLGMAHNLP
jgi:hypothetical protein